MSFLTLRSFDVWQGFGVAFSRFADREFSPSLCSSLGDPAGMTGERAEARLWNTEVEFSKIGDSPHTGASYTRLTDTTRIAAGAGLSKTNL